MLDSAVAPEGRGAEEVDEDAEADAWAARRGAWPDDEDDDFVPLAHVPS
jgi:hypothetical protein